MPKQYYQVLGVEPTATIDEIKLAYRAKAKALHPDVNKTRDTTRDFQDLQEAYFVLGSPERRKLYDSGNETAATNPETQATEADFDPFPCISCERISAQPRFIYLYWVTSFLIFSYRRQSSGVYCPACAAKKLFWSSLITGSIGWLGFPWGIIWSIKALIYNIQGGKQCDELNALVLTKQAIYFEKAGSPEIAAAVAAEARKFSSKAAHTKTGAACLKAIESFVGQKVVLKSKWTGLSAPRLNALAGFAIPCVIWTLLIQSSEKDHIDRMRGELEKQVLYINAKCPKMIDEITRLDGTSEGPGLQLNYNYTIISANARDVDAKKLHDAIQASAKEAVKKDYSVNSQMQKGVIFVYNYFGKDGALITSFSLSRESLNDAH
jgi:hypothetical protein